MKHFMLGLIVALFSTALFAQNNFSIRGIVADSSDKKTIAYATVALYADSAKEAINAAITQDDGTFLLEKIPKGKYRIEVLMIGFGNKNIPLFSLENDKNMGTILLAVQDAKTNEVVITGKRPIIEMTDDKIVYNVGDDPNAKVGNGLDVLKKTPFVSVDGKDEIYLKGEKNFKVQLNGKNTGIMSKNPADALKSFPAASIKKIEVITSPGAKYDAEGVGGIINIITYKEMNGYRGGVYTSGGYGKYGYNYGVGANFSAKVGKWGFSTWFGDNANGNKGFSSSETKSLSAQYPFRQVSNGTSSDKGNWLYGNFEIAYDIDSLISLSFYGTTYGGGNKYVSTGTFQTLGNNDSLLLDRNYVYNNQNNYPYYEGGLDYVQKYKVPEQELTISLHQEINPGGSKSQNANYNTPGADLFSQNSNQNRSNETTFNTDYVQPLPKNQKLYVGAKVILRAMYSDYSSNFFDSTSGTYLRNEALSNEFRYNQGVFSFYSEYSFKLKNVSFKPGVRLERTMNDADFLSTNTKITQNYLNFIPTLTISYKMKEKHNLKLSYTKRIQRPGIWLLNPYADISNPQFISKGNPNLLPSIAHVMSVGYSTFGEKGNINISLSETYTTGRVSSFTVFDPSTRVSTTSNYNVGKGFATGLDGFISGNLTKKWEYYVNGRISHVLLLSDFNGNAYQRTGFYGNGYFNTSYKLSEKFEPYLYGYFYTGEITLQGKQSGYYDYGVGCNYKIVKDKWNLSLGLQNFASNKITLYAYQKDPNFESSNQFSRAGRMLTLSLDYSFGKLEDQVSRKKGVQNDDGASGGKGGGK